MSSLLGLLILGFAIYRNVKRLAENQNDKMKEKDILKKDFQGVPIEVQRAIARGKTPPKSSLESTAFGDKKNKKEEKNKEELIERKKEVEKKVLDIVQDQEREIKSVPRNESHPLDFVESYDPAVRPVIYQEILSQPKCKRK